MKMIMNPYVTSIMKFITNFGGATIVLIIAIISIVGLWKKENHKMSFAILINLTCVTILNQGAKRIIQRDRPTEYRIVDAKGYSFPSGHSMVSMAFYGFFIYLIYKYCKNKVIRNIAITFLSLLIILIGMSRIYLGVHYTSDVIAGFVTSIAYLMAFTKLYGKLLSDEEKNGNNENLNN